MTEAKILIVEDESIVAKDLQRSLENLGYIVPARVASGEQAIRKAERDNPDLVLMDIVLQGEMDGIEAAGQIHSRFNIPVIYLTAFSDEKVLERAKITEPFGYILKPFEDRELHITIEMALYKDKMEKKLKETQLQLIQSGKMTAIGELAGGVAHEFNNLLMGIRGYAEFARLKKDEKTVSKALDVILTSSDRAKNLIDKLLSFSRPNESQFQWTSLEDLINDTLVLIEKQMEIGNIQITRDFKSSVRIRADASKLQQTFLHLLINAHHAMPEGGSLTVSTRMKTNESNKVIPAERCVEIAFKDTGCGIPSQNIDRVFEPFFTTKGALGGGSISGTGLGLSLSYKCIKDHNGTIKAESEVDKGTTFTITLPVDSFSGP